MADSGIKNTIIKNSDLPPRGERNNIVVRYRVISEDKNRTSSWSPQYDLIAITPATVQGTIDVTSKVVNLVWTDSETMGDKEAYDVFIKIDNGAWRYAGTSYIHGFSMVKPIGTSISVEIQLEGIVKERNSLLKVYEGTESLL